MLDQNKDHQYMQEIDQFEYEEILEYYSKGLDIKDISKITNVSEESIDKLLLSLGAKFY